jgi:hypothetical protein
MTDAFEIHAIHGRVHPSHDTGHVPSNLPHGHRRFYPAGYSVDTTCKPQQAQSFALLADGV